MASNFSSLLLNMGVAKGNNLMRFVTGIRYTASVAKFLNNMTFLYDPNWSYGNYEETSLPLSFFFVKSWQEIGESEISTKPMMFYNSQATKETQTVNGAVMNVVADNNIIQPKLYKADVLVPFKPDSYFEQYQFDPDTLAGSLAFACNASDSASATISAFGRVSSVALTLLRTILSALCVDLDVASLSSLILSQNDINKVSLDAMRQNRGILKMKVWNGWKFKYVMLKSIELSKSGEVEGFYEGSITVMEVPMLNVGLEEEDIGIAKGKSLLGKSLSLKAQQEAEALSQAIPIMF
jgi:hypothetical protein